MNMVADDRFSQTDDFRYQFVPIQSAVGEKPVSRISSDQLNAFLNPKSDNALKRSTRRRCAKAHYARNFMFFEKHHL